MTNEDIRKLCRASFQYGKDGDSFEDFLMNEGTKVAPKDQLTLDYMEKNDSLRGYYKTIIERFDENYDHNIVTEIIRKAKGGDKEVKGVELMCSKSFIEKFEEIFSYKNHGSEYNYNSFGLNSPIGRKVLKHKGVKLTFKWIKQ